LGTVQVLAGQAAALAAESEIPHRQADALYCRGLLNRAPGGWQPQNAMKTPAGPCRRRTRPGSRRAAAARRTLGGRRSPPAGP